MYTLLLAGFLAAGPVQVDLLLVNGRIWTGDPSHPEATILAARNGRILFLMTDAEAAEHGDFVKSISATRTVDLKGRRVVPGFYDSHVHLLGGGRGLSQVALKDAPDETEFGRRLKDFDGKLPRGQWMLGGDWDHDRALKGQLPTALLLDRFVADRPVFINRYDGHMAVVNSLALKLAGITAQTPDPTGGVIVRDAKGNPTGLLRDNAMSLVARVIPPPGETEVAQALRAALEEARKQGVTSVTDMDGSDAKTRRIYFRLLQAMARKGSLTLRVDWRLPIGEYRQLADLGAEANFGSDWVTIGGLKGFADGSLGSSTAKMFEPYVNEPNTTGVFVTPPGLLKMAVIAADKAGLSVAIHAIGDRANSDLLDIYADVAKANGPRDRRFRIEHAQHLRPQDCKRFADLGVIASMQPYHVIDDGRWAEGRIGAKRCASSYAYRSLLDVGATLAFGSDWPVAPLNVLEGIDAAVNRRTLDGKDPNGWFPDQKIRVEEALRAYGHGSAYAAYQESHRGTLAVGKLADCVVLSADVLDPKQRDQIGRTHVEATIVGGRVVYERK